MGQNGVSVWKCWWCGCVVVAFSRREAYTCRYMEHETHNHADHATHDASHGHHHPHTRRMHKKVVGVGAAIVLAGAIAGGYVALMGNPFVYTYPPQLPEQLREKTHAAVATVNGEKIDRDAYNSMLASVAEMAVQGGASVDDAAVQKQIKRSALDAIISNTLLMQAATKSGAVVDDKKVDEQVLAVSLQVGGDEKFAEELAKVGLTEAKYRETVKNQLILNAYLETVAPTETIVVTDAEIKAFYDARIKTAPAGTTIPKLADVTEQIRDYIKNDKYQKLVQAHITTLREGASIEERITI